MTAAYLSAQAGHRDGPVSPAPAAGNSTALLSAALDASSEAVLLCTGDHEILLVNSAAMLLVPELGPGADASQGPLRELAEAIADGAESFAAVHAGRQIRGIRRPLDDEHHGWYLQDVTQLEREQIDTTAMLQADLLPPELPQPEGVELVGSYQAAHDALPIGGDFYDVYGPTARGSETVIVLGDVCGRGPEAAVLTGKVRQTLRALRLVEVPPEEMLRVLNQALLESSRQHRFVTLVVGSVSRADHGRVRLTLASGGHPPPLVLRADGTVEEVPAAGTLIGVVPHISVRPATVELAPGEVCLLYSDGLTEARGGPSGTEQYGEERLHGALASCRGMPAAATVERVRRLVFGWVHGGERDDIAMMLVRAPSRTPLSLRGGGAPNTSPFAIDARRDVRRPRARP